MVVIVLKANILYERIEDITVIRIENNKIKFNILGIKFSFKVKENKYLEKIISKRIIKNYENNLKNIICKKQKIKIGFLVWENCKWSYENLYHLLENDINYDPYILLVQDKSVLVDLEKNKHFFTNYKTLIIKNEKDIIQNDFHVIFYEQPWFALNGEFSPQNISKHALTFYVPYGIELNDNDTFFAPLKHFYKNIFILYTFDILSDQKLISYNFKNNVIVGHPRLDAYNNKDIKKYPWKSKDKIKIIYAPHFSFAKSLLKLATWEWNGDYILQLAQKHQDTTEWIFKPHPHFKLELGRLLKSNDKAEKVFEEWAKVSTLYDEGNYFDIFKTADLMISDCCSFKIEWLPTLKPYIELMSHYENTEEFPLMEHYCSGYYKAESIKDIENYFNSIVKEHKDPKYKIREELNNSLPKNASLNIYNHINKLFKIKEK